MEDSLERAAHTGSTRGARPDAPKVRRIPGEAGGPALPAPNVNTHKVLGFHRDVYVAVATLDLAAADERGKEQRVQEVVAQHGGRTPRRMRRIPASP
jgi:hypothetical protein